MGDIPNSLETSFSGKRSRCSVNGATRKQAFQRSSVSRDCSIYQDFHIFHFPRFHDGRLDGPEATVGITMIFTIYSGIDFTTAWSDCLSYYNEYHNLRRNTFHGLETVGT